MAKDLSGMTDAELEALAQQVVAEATGTPENYGVTAADVGLINDAGAALSTSSSNQTSAINAARAATAAKEADRTTLIGLLRSFRAKAKAHGTSESLMQATGMPSGAATVSPETASIPLAKVDTSRRLQHTIHWSEATTPDNKKRPRGVMGADIYCKIDGPPPTDASQCNFVTTDSATPYLVEYSGDDAGKMAHYMLRWRYRDGGVGAWGETVSATITG